MGPGCSPTLAQSLLVVIPLSAPEKMQAKGGGSSVFVLYPPSSGVLIQGLIVRVSRASERLAHWGLVKPVSKAMAWNKP